MAATPLRFLRHCGGGGGYSYLAICWNQWCDLVDFGLQVVKLISQVGYFIN